MQVLGEKGAAVDVTSASLLAIASDFRSWGRVMTQDGGDTEMKMDVRFRSSAGHGQ